jgi:RNA polymerase sigma-70 factor (ECF subfamily)
MPTAKTDAELMSAFRQAGEVAAFEELVQRHHRNVINFFYHLARDRQQAEDWAQEVFLRLVAHARTYVPRAKFTTYLYRIARNLWIDVLRERAHRVRPASLDAPGADGEQQEAWVPAASRQPAEALMRGEAADAVRRAIDRLPEELRDVVVLSELQGLRYAEIAEILGIPVGTVKSRMHTAVQRLKALLAPLDGATTAPTCPGAMPAGAAEAAPGAAGEPARGAS